MKNKKILFNGILIIGLIFSSCSNDDKENNDTTTPVVRIQSPLVILNYSTDIGNSNVPYKVNLMAYGTDETEIATLKLTITDSNGIVVLEKNQESDMDSKYTLNISDKFETTNPGTYTAIFTATDANGNTTSESKVFTYVD